MKKVNIQTFACLVMLVICSFFACKKDKTPVAETVTDVDGNEYKTVKIGTQTWMVENLRVTHYNTGTTVSDEIPMIENADEWKNLTEPGYCWYNNNKADNENYGILYNGYVVSSSNLAPKGWHIATNADWQTLMAYLTNNGYDYNGTTGQYTIAKSLAAVSGWLEIPSNDIGDVENDQSSNNKSGFTALPGGFRYEDGSFGEEGITANFWHLIGPGNPSYTQIKSNSQKAYLFFTSMGTGYSVRCVKD